jgi:hypothetical protein
MSAWRQKAIECAPELRNEFQAPDLTPYTVFIELLPITIQAHIDRDNERLQKIYDFAEWCHYQKDQNLWNAVGVTFYEHLTDRDETFLQFTNWIKKEIYLEIRGLLLHRASDKKIKKLDDYYRYRQPK